MTITKKKRKRRRGKRSEREGAREKKHFQALSLVHFGHLLDWVTGMAARLLTIMTIIETSAEEEGKERNGRALVACVTVYGVAFAGFLFVRAFTIRRHEYGKRIERAR